MSSTTNSSPPSSLSLTSDYSRFIPQSGYQSRDVKPIVPLPPISVDKPPVSFDPAPVDIIYPPSPQFNSSEDDLPAALVHPNMPFNTVTDPKTRHTQRSVQPTYPLPVQPSGNSRASTAGSTSSGQTRDAVMDMMAMFSSEAPLRKKYTASQLAQWRAEEAYYKAKIQEESGGKEICLIRYEARQGWLGFWNKENVLDIIDDLRELRAPKS